MVSYIICGRSAAPPPPPPPPAAAGNIMSILSRYEKKNYEFLTYIFRKFNLKNLTQKTKNWENMTRRIKTLLKKVYYILFIVVIYKKQIVIITIYVWLQAETSE